MKTMRVKLLLCISVCFFIFSKPAIGSGAFGECEAWELWCWGPDLYDWAVHLEENTYEDLGGPVFQKANDIMLGHNPSSSSLTDRQKAHLLNYAKFINSEHIAIWAEVLEKAKVHYNAMMIPDVIQEFSEYGASAQSFCANIYLQSPNTWDDDMQLLGTLAHELLHSFQCDQITLGTPEAKKLGELEAIRAQISSGDCPNGWFKLSTPMGGRLCDELSISGQINLGGWCDGFCELEREINDLRQKIIDENFKIYNWGRAYALEYSRANGVYENNLYEVQAYQFEAAFIAEMYKAPPYSMVYTPEQLDSSEKHGGDHAQRVLTTVIIPLLLD